MGFTINKRRRPLPVWAFSETAEVWVFASPIFLFDSLVHRSASFTDVELCTVESKRRDPHMQWANHETKKSTSLFKVLFTTMTNLFYDYRTFSQPLHVISIVLVLHWLSRFFCKVNLNFHNNPWNNSHTLCLLCLSDKWMMIVNLNRSIRHNINLQ